MVLKTKINEIIFIVETDPEGGYTAKALNDSIFTEGDTLEILKENIKCALDCHFENDEEKPQIIRLHIIRDEIYSYV
ncbi:MAG: 2-oxoisovalerate dehydrogenase [Spirochaetes bacterium GWB1_36_13]|nr:MAG: 2-oxoisovalerate dehydrogenase [Spirochaetes bacterium GWB1_36_13]